MILTKKIELIHSNTISGNDKILILTKCILL